MQYNTALAFLLSGVALLAYTRKALKVTVTLGAIVLFFGVATQAQYVFNWDLHIDQLFIFPYVTSLTSHPGRASPITAIAFALTGLAFVLCKLRFAVFFFVLLGSSVAGLGAMALAVNIAKLGQVIEWVEFTRVAIHTAVGLFFIGIALLYCAKSEHLKANLAVDSGQPVPFASSLQTQWMLYLTGLLAVCGGILALTGYTVAREILVQQIHEHLSVLASDRTKTLLSFIDFEKERVALVASRTSLRRIIEACIKNELPSDTFKAEGLLNLKAVLKSAPSFQRISILNDAGEVLLDTDQSPFPASLLSDPEFKLGREEMHFFAPSRLNEQTRLLITGPLFNPDGKRMAQLVVFADGRELRQRLSEYEGLGTSGEVLIGRLVENRVQLLLPPRNQPQLEFIDSERAPVMSGAIKGQNGFKQALDYRGILVLAAHRSIPSMNWGLIVKMDAVEAYAAVRGLQWLLLLLWVAFMTVGLFLAHSLSRHLLTPLQELSAVANTISTGDLSVRGNVIRSDEIGQLGYVFNRMAEQIQEARAGLEKRIHERTAELAASEELLRQFIRFAPASVAMMDTNMRYLQVSDRWLHDYRLQQGELIGKSHYDVFPDIPERWKEIHRRVLAGAVEHCDEDSFVRADGTIVWLQWEAHPWLKASGEIGGLMLYTQVITQRKKDEEALRESNERLQLTLDAAHIVAWEFNLITQARIETGPRHEFLSNAKASQNSIVESLLNLADKADAVPIDSALQAARHGGNYSVEYRIPLQDGRTRWIAEQGTMFRGAGGKPEKLLGIARDVTERRIAQEKLLETQLRFSNAFKHSGIGMALVTLDGHWLDVNDALCAIVGYTREELFTKTFQDITHPEDVDEDLANLQRLIAGEIQSYEMEKRYIRKDGHIVWVVLTVSLVRFSDGSPNYFVSQIQNITRRKELEKERAQLLAILEEAPDYIGVCDMQGNLKFHNRAALRMLGLPEDTDLGAMKVSDMHPTWAGDIIAQKALPGVLEFGTWHHETALLHRNGTEIPVSQVLILHRDAAGEPELISTIMRDITERKRQEHELRTSLDEKVALLKEIHHRVKNNLQIVSSLLRLQANKLDDPRLHAVIDECQQRVRAMVMVHERMYRSNELARIDFGEYLKELCNDLSRAYSANPGVAIVTEVDPVAADIDTVIPCALLTSEAVTNAFKYAFPAGRKGTITVRLRELEKGRRVLLEIADDGIGLPLDYKERRGLGMKLIEGFARQIKGTLTIHSEQGARYRIEFPLTES